MSEKLNLNDLKPKLKECQVFTGEKNIVIEDSKTRAQVVLLKENEVILKLLDGENTVKDISTYLYHHHGGVNFNTIITTIRLLSEANLLEGTKHYFENLRDEKSPHEQKPSFFNRSLFEFPLVRKIEMNIARPELYFGLLGMLVMMVGMNLDAFDNIHMARFLKNQSGYSEALPRIFIFSSILLSMKTLFQGLMLLFSVGSFYAPSIKINLYSISLGLNDNTIYSHPKKAVIISYGVMSALMYLVCFALIDYFPQAKMYRHDFAVLAMMLTLIELNPYRRSELTKLFYFFYAAEQLKSIMPYLKNCTLTGLWEDTGAKLSDEVRYVTYSLLAIGWAIFFSVFSLELMFKCFSGLFLQIQMGEPVSRISAILVGMGLLFISGYLSIDLFHTLVKNIVSPILLPLMKLKARPKDYTQPDIALENIRKNLQANMIFNQLSPEALDYVLNNARLKSVKKGTHLILQGDTAKEVFFLVKGRVDVNSREKTGRIKHIVELGPNSVIGEMSIVEKRKRAVNVTALEDLVFLEFSASVFENLMNKMQFKEDYIKLTNRIKISQFVASANLFRDFPPEIMNVFVEAGDLVLFPGGHNIVEEGESDKTFYLLIKGKVDISKGGHHITELKQGDFFGEVALIANVPRTATVTTKEESLFLFIEDKRFWNILSNNIELAMYIESVGRSRMNEAA
ncbi:MAG: cyclic nucleotide-binding domain-containing protein [Bacteriovoracaceae bacterium]|nr:cyclic nucleotide-binding domain-containing protein [Bacteriovoracaceae bacterium]